MKKKLVAMALAAAMVLSMAACGGNSETTAAAGESGGAAETAAEGTAANAENEQVEVSGASSKDTLIIANTYGEPGNLHPYNMVSIPAKMMQYMLFDGLIVVDENGNPQPNLAESWEVTDEAITFHLRNDIVFSNGEPMTVDDVVFSLQELLHSSGGLQTNYSSCDLENVETPDDSTVVIPLLEANMAQLSYFGEFFVVDQSAYEEMGEDYQFNPVGTGPFVVDSWTVGDNITFKRNENYWGEAPLLDRVVVRTISEVSQAMIELETGGVDLVLNPDGTDVQRVLNGEVDGVKAVTMASMVLRNNNINFNHNSEYISNKLVREAVAHCIDRENWVSIISPGTGVPAYCNVASGIWGWDETMADRYPYAYDIEAAKACLAEAGYADGISLTILTDNRSYHQALIELLQASLAQAGIELKVETMELNKQKEVMTTGEGYDLYLLDNVGNSYDPLSSLWRDSNPEYSGEGGTNYLNYTLEKEGAQEYCDILHQIRTCADETEKKELCSKMQDIFAENLVFLPVNSIQQYVLATDSIQNLSFASDILRITNTTFFE